MRLCRALTAWYSDREGWADLIARCMSQDWSWTEPALDYIELWVASAPCLTPPFNLSVWQGCWTPKPAAWPLPSLHKSQRAGLHLQEGAADVHSSATDPCSLLCHCCSQVRACCRRVQVLQSAEGVSTSPWSPGFLAIDRPASSSCARDCVTQGLQWGEAPNAENSW